MNQTTQNAKSTALSKKNYRGPVIEDISGPR